MASVRTLRFASSIGFLAFLVAAGCSQDRPPRCPDELSQRFPRARYITACGVSDNGAREAQNEAVAEVVQQIKSSIQAVTVERSESLSRGGEAELSQLVRTEMKVRGTFAHGELIRQAELEAKVREQGKYSLAFAFLERGAADRVLADESQKAEAELAAARARAATAHAAGDLQAVADATRVAEQAGATLEVVMAQRVAVLGGRPEMSVDPAQVIAELRAQSAALRSQTRWVVRVEAGTLAPNEQRRVATAVEGVLSRLSLVTATADQCTAAATTVFALDVKASPDCRSGHLGHVCELALGIDGRRCSAPDSVLFHATPGSQALKGAHPKQIERAREKVFEALTADNLQDDLRRVLGTVVPL